MQVRTRVDTQVARVLSAVGRILRVHYRENQRLRTADLRDEQSYLIAGSRRHKLGAHGWGIVTGLALYRSEDGSAPFLVQPGLAFDIYGHDLILLEPLTIPPGDLAGFEDTEVDIGIRYRLSSMSAGRVYEEGEIFASSGIDWKPEAEADYLQIGDAPNDSPPVYLGTLSVNSEGVSLSTQQKLRRYSGFYASSVLSSNGQVLLTLGSEAENDPRRFAVATVDSDGNAFHDQLMINRRGDTFLYGNTNLKPDNVDDSRTLLINGSVLRLEPHAPSKSAQPWRFYSVTDVEGEGDEQHSFTELRVELFHPGKAGNPQDYRLEIYAPDSEPVDGKFKHPLFTVIADGTVIVHGDVIADEVLIAPIDADPSNPDFQDLLQKTPPPIFNQDGLTLKITDLPAQVTRGSAISAKARITNVLQTNETIETIEVYLDMRAGTTPLRGSGKVPIPTFSLRKGEWKDIPLHISKEDTANYPVGTKLMVLVVAYGNKANGQVAVAYGSAASEVIQAPQPGGGNNV